MKIKQTNVFNSEILKLYFGFLPEELSFIGVSTHTWCPGWPRPPWGASCCCWRPDTSTAVPCHSGPASVWSECSARPPSRLLWRSCLWWCRPCTRGPRGAALPQWRHTGWWGGRPPWRGPQPQSRTAACRGPPGCEAGKEELTRFTSNTFVKENSTTNVELLKMISKYFLQHH